MSMIAALASLCAAGVPRPALAADTRAAVTFSKDVVPIFQRKCQVCHRPGTVAPMSLVAYDDARPWARSIKQRVAQREMPPWHIDKSQGIQHYKNDRSLSDVEIATVVAWSALTFVGAVGAAVCAYPLFVKPNAEKKTVAMSSRPVFVVVPSGSGATGSMALRF